jgi:ABC-type multidrug transport system ATPase subunit
VTHDRRFLDRVAQRIIELDRGRLASFPGNFTEYEKRKAEMLAIEAVRERKFDKELAQEEAWIRQGVEARRTRNEGRVRRLEALREERAARRQRVGKVELAVSAGERSGRLVAELENVTGDSARRSSSTISRAASCAATRSASSDRTAAARRRCCASSSARSSPMRAACASARRSTVAYFDQFRAVLDEEATLADTISPGSDFVELDGGRKHIISYLGDFLFAPERSRSPVKSLSGGERNRLLLARLFARPANVLVLDEPTNDLDIETLELLESLLQEYTGTLFLVSHDRAFLDNVVTQSIAFEGAGRWKEYAGGYTDWKRASGAKPEPSPPKDGPPARKRAPATEKPAKLGYKEARELEEIPALIEAIERDQKELARQVADPATYQDRSIDVKALNMRPRRERSRARAPSGALGSARGEEERPLLVDACYSHPADFLVISLHDRAHPVPCSRTSAWRCSRRRRVDRRDSDRRHRRLHLRADGRLQREVLGRAWRQRARPGCAHYGCDHAGAPAAKAISGQGGICVLTVSGNVACLGSFPPYTAASRRRLPRFPWGERMHASSRRAAASNAGEAIRTVSSVTGRRLRALSRYRWPAWTAA